MAILANRVSVTTSQTRLDAGTSVWRAIVTNRGTAAVYLGPTGVSTSTGYQLDPGASLSVELGASDPGLYAIAASGTQTVHTLAVND